MAGIETSFGIKGNVYVDTSQAENSINNLNAKLGGMKTPPLSTISGENPAMSEAQADATENTEDLADSFSDLQEQMAGVLRGFKSLCESLDSTADKVKKQGGRTFTNPSEDRKMNEATTELANAGNLIVNLDSDTGNLASRGLGNVGKSLKNISSMTEDEDIASQLGKAGFIASLIGLGIGIANEPAKKYEEKLGSNDSLLMAFGGEGFNLNSSRGNANWADLARKSAIAYSMGSGMGVDDFISLASGLSGYGITNADQALGIAQKSANLARYTNSDASQIAGFAGLIERMGGNSNNLLSSVYGAARASGLDRTQFGEFLQGVQSAMESGISKGFVKSADDVSKQLATISALSGENPLWSGKYGAERYNQMSNAMGNNTSLQSTSSLLMYQAAKNVVTSGKNLSTNDAILETLKFMEGGNLGNVDFLQALGSSVNSAYKGDRLSQVSAYKDMFGVNWTQASQIKDLIDNSAGMNGEDLGTKIQEIMDKENPTKAVESFNTDFLDAKKEITDALANSGKGAFETKNLASEGLGNMFYNDKDTKHFSFSRAANFERHAMGESEDPLVLEMQELYQEIKESNNSDTMRRFLEAASSAAYEDKYGNFGYNNTPEFQNLIKELKELTDAVNSQTGATKANTTQLAQPVTVTTSSNYYQGSTGSQKSVDSALSRPSGHH